MHCNTKFDKNVNKNGSKSPQMVMEMFVVVWYIWTNKLEVICRLLHILVTFLWLLFMFLFIRGRPSSAFTLFTRNCQFEFFPQLKKAKKFYECDAVDKFKLKFSVSVSVLILESWWIGVEILRRGFTLWSWNFQELSVHPSPKFWYLIVCPRFSTLPWQPNYHTQVWPNFKFLDIIVLLDKIHHFRVLSASV